MYAQLLLRLELQYLKENYKFLVYRYTIVAEPDQKNENFWIRLVTRKNLSVRLPVVFENGPIEV